MSILNLVINMFFYLIDVICCKGKMDVRAEILVKVIKEKEEWRPVRRKDARWGRKC